MKQFFEKRGKKEEDKNEFASDGAEAKQILSNMKIKLLFPKT